jgi:hypothetical protein
MEHLKASSNTERIAIVGNVFNATILLQHLAKKHNFKTFSTLHEWNESREPGVNSAVWVSWDEATTESLMEFTNIIETDLDRADIILNRKYDTMCLMRNYKGVGETNGGDVTEMLCIFDGIMRAILGAYD